MHSKGKIHMRSARKGYSKDPRTMSRLFTLPNVPKTRRIPRPRNPPWVPGKLHSIWAESPGYQGVIKMGNGDPVLKKLLFFSGDSKMLNSDICTIRCVCPYIFAAKQCRIHKVGRLYRLTTKYSKRGPDVPQTIFSAFPYTHGAVPPHKRRLHGDSDSKMGWGDGKRRARSRYRRPTLVRFSALGRVV